MMTIDYTSLFFKKENINLKLYRAYASRKKGDDYEFVFHSMRGFIPISNLENHDDTYVFSKTLFSDLQCLIESSDTQLSLNPEIGYYEIFEMFIPIKVSNATSIHTNYKYLDCIPA